MPLTIAIIGRPNVGKSTLFNRLTGKQHAIVDDQPGVTRDRRIGEGRIGPFKFTVMDTAGLEEAAPDALESRMLQQTERAVDEAQVALMLVDGRAGITPIDRHFALWLRKKGKPIILVVNKCESSAGQDGLAEFYSLGLGDPIGISSAHGYGMGDLFDALKAYDTDEMPDEGRFRVDANLDIVASDEESTKEEEDANKPIQIAIIGRPNVGKSTLLNTLLNEDRVLTGPEAGITRDAIAIDWEFKGRPVRLIDTAGMRRKTKIDDKVEKLSVSDTLRAVKYAHVVVMVIDANHPLEHQELAILELVIREGRAVVLALNKWDTVKEQDAVLKELHYRVDELLPQIKGVPVITLSALTGKNTEKLMQSCLNMYKVWNTYISTTKLNHWLRDAESHHPPPLANNKLPIRLKYMTQGKKRPPAFMLFSNKPDQIPESYIRYLINKLRVDFGVPGIPLRMLLRKAENPYAGRRKPKYPKKSNG